MVPNQALIGAGCYGVETRPPDMSRAIWWVIEQGVSGSLWR